MGSIGVWQDICSVHIPLQLSAIQFLCIFVFALPHWSVADILLHFTCLQITTPFIEVPISALKYASKDVWWHLLSTQVHPTCNCLQHQCTVFAHILTTADLHPDVVCDSYSLTCNHWKSRLAFLWLFEWLHVSYDAVSDLVVKPFPRRSEIQDQ